MISLDCEACGRAGHRLRRIDAHCAHEVEIIAQRMRQTLVEVLGQERGSALYTMDWLRQRVLWHLDPQRARAAVFVSEDDAARVTGHTIVRVEREEPDARPIGLFSTTFVEPGSRRRGIADCLLCRGERWMREERMAEAVTYTATHNDKLIGLYQKHGYVLRAAGTEMVRLAKPLAPLA